MRGESTDYQYDQPLATGLRDLFKERERGTRPISPEDIEFLNRIEELVDLQDFKTSAAVITRASIGTPYSSSYRVIDNRWALWHFLELLFQLDPDNVRHGFLEGVSEGAASIRWNAMEARLQRVLLRMLRFSAEKLGIAEALERMLARDAPELLLAPGLTIAPKHPNTLFRLKRSELREELLNSEDGSRRTTIKSFLSSELSPSLLAAVEKLKEFCSISGVNYLSEDFWESAATLLFDERSDDVEFALALREMYLLLNSPLENLKLLEGWFDESLLFSENVQMRSRLLKGLQIELHRANRPHLTSRYLSCCVETQALIKSVLLAWSYGL